MKSSDAFKTSLFLVWVACSNPSYADDGALLSPNADDVQLVINCLPISYRQNPDLPWVDISQSLTKALSLLRKEANLVESRSVLSFDTRLLPAMKKAVSGISELSISETGNYGEVIYSPIKVQEVDNEIESLVLEALAEVHYRMYEFELAEKYLQEALLKLNSQNSPHAKRIMLGLSRLHRRLQKFEKAEKMLAGVSSEDLDDKSILDDLEVEATNLEYDQRQKVSVFSIHSRKSAGDKIVKPAFKDAKGVHEFAKSVATKHNQQESEVDGGCDAMKALVLGRLPASIGKKALERFMASERFKELEDQRKAREQQRKAQLLAVLDEILGLTKARERAEKALSEHQQFQKDLLTQQQEIYRKREENESKRLDVERERQSRESEERAMQEWSEKNRQITGTSYMSRYKN